MLGDEHVCVTMPAFGKKKNRFPNRETVSFNLPAGSSTTCPARRVAFKSITRWFWLPRETQRQVALRFEIRAVNQIIRQPEKLGHTGFAARGFLQKFLIRPTGIDRQIVFRLVFNAGRERCQRFGLAERFARPKT